MKLTFLLPLGAVDFPYFYNPLTGLPRTPRPLTRETATCVDGFSMETFVPSLDTMQRGLTNRGAPYYEIVLPTVRQVVKNHFNCQEMTGM
jgi:hypothetical protein